MENDNMKRGKTTSEIVEGVIADTAETPVTQIVEKVDAVAIMGAT